ncbi:YjeF-related protein N-terminus-domain-containing protein [Nemania sp. FL0916]|nr:YjeF-related protein N-terminus-domain-containing protein [Nemania sp. FL0916]
MERSPLSQWLGGPYQVVLKAPAGERVTGILSSIIPEQHLTLEKVTVVGTGQTFERVDIVASNVADIIPVQALQPEPKPKLKPMSSASPAASPATTRPTSTTATSSSAGTGARRTFQDPAIVSMARKPTIQTAGHAQKAAPSEATTPRAPHFPIQAVALSLSSPGETDTTETTALPSLASRLSIQTSPHPSTHGPVPLSNSNGNGLGLQDLTPTAATVTATAQPAPLPRERDRRRGKHGKRQQNPKPALDGTPASNARPTNQGKGWRQTPILQSTQSFQPFASLRKSQRRRGDHAADSGWASEDVTDVQEAGDFDFEGSLAKFDKHSIFNEMREQDRIDEADRLVAHNRLPKPKPGTAGGKNFHYAENVLEPSPAAPRIAKKETPGDFWRSEADDDEPVSDGDGGNPASGREGSGRNSRLRAESRMSTARRSQSRKASASATIAGPSRVNTGPMVGSPTLPGLYTSTSNRRIDTVTHLQMLVVENVAGNELGMTEDLIAENAGRGICEVAMRALEDPAVQLRATVSSPPAASTIAVVAGNNKSGARAIAAARHLRNRGVNMLVCVVGIERERELLDDIRKQIRLFRNFGGSIYTKSEFFEHTAQSANSLDPSPQIVVSLIIDALLGLTISFEELRKSDQATTYELMEWANRSESFVLAIDLPSGIEPSTGRVNVIDGAKLYIQPRYVVALGAPKAGLVKALESMDEAGDTITANDWKLYLADIGLGATVWRKAAKIRRGADFDGNWVLALRYRWHREDN